MAYLFKGICHVCRQPYESASKEIAVHWHDYGCSDCQVREKARTAALLLRAFLPGELDALMRGWPLVEMDDRMV